MNILKDNKNKLLNRREIEAVFTSESNPGFDKSKKFISGELKCDENLIVIKKLESRFGRDSFVVDAVVYDSENDLKRIEPAPKAKKGAK